MVKITKSLSVGLTTACFSTMLFMSSCSKEDAFTPTPQSDVNQSSKLREAAGGGILAVQYIPTTDGPTGLSSAPNKWNFDPYDPFAKSPNATSNLTAFAGDPLMKWGVPLPVPSTGPGNIITVSNDYGSMDAARTNIKNLVIGKKYKFTYSVSTTTLTNNHGLAQEAILTLYSPGNYMEYKTDFNNQESKWITKSIEFVAKNTWYDLEFKGRNESSPIIYTNIHVGKNAVKVIN